MTPRRLAVCLLAIALSIGVPGCGRFTETLDVAVDAEPTGPVAIASVAAPDAALVDNAVVAEAARSVVRIQTMAPSCQKTLAGSGVVIAPNKVMSAAHAVAGGGTVSVWVGDREQPATVVVFDPYMDIAVLDVPDLQAPPLAFADTPAITGTDAVVLGYPGGGPFTATPARIREVIELQGPDIYRTTTLKREVYVIRGAIRQGESGGPLLGLDRRVLGISFGAAVDEPDTGFVLTAKQIFALMLEGVGASQPVETGACVVA
ncbi:MarP family serine protease [Mycobacterium sp. IS-3022]|uniref:MarP family serine protease n=1 Tax=Mycobacterium sp. IS-3022 TaxID=1772277 RepID=UPI0007415BBA|nr:MarP family serine protease [Mycobacterium sp. IS-3022]KUH99075.1 hypothetical protein AU188_10305 [Mycobacterium sp. IS-3022]